MDNSIFKKHSPIKFFLLVLLLSIPFWILAAMTRDLAVLLAITAIAITWLWGTETLGKYRFLVQSGSRGEA